MSKQKYATTGKKKIKAPSVLVAIPKLRYPAPMAAFPVSFQGTSTVLDAIKRVCFADCPEKFEVKFYRSQPSRDIPYIPIPDFIAPPDSVIIQHRRVNGRWIPQIERSTP